MFQRLFRRDRASNRAITEALYLKIVAAARQPLFYSDWGVPDTPLGRYEMMSLHMLLALRRMRADDGALRDIAQEITDHFFLEMDHSLRELGVGDMGVPKRMKRLAKMFYGRAEAYSQALDKGDADELSAALSRNIWPQEAAEADAPALAAYAVETARRLDAIPLSVWQAGEATFPSAGKKAT